VSGGGGVPPRTGIWLFPDAPVGALVDLAVHAESLGVDELWLGDEGPARDPFVALGAIAARTSRLGLGIGVTNPYLRHPAITAVAAMTVHEASGGRAILGIGPGGAIALGPLGIARERPLAQTREAVRIIRAVTRGVATDGYAPPPRPFTAPDLPVWVGARGEGFNRFASEAADGVFIGGVPLPLHETVIGWAHSVRPIDVAIYVNAVFDPAEVEAVRPRLVYALVDAPEVNRTRLGVPLAEASRAAAALSAGDAGPARRLITDDVLDRLILRGSPVEVGRRLARIGDLLCPDSLGVALLTPDLDRGVSDAAESFEAFHHFSVREVIA
jgi:5,10-methylenetetrahydromethanopterin reductase